MKNLKTRILSVVLVLVLLLSTLVLPSTAASTQPTTYSKDSNSGQRNVVCTTLSGTSASSYYTGSYTYEILSELSSNSLQSQLKTLMTQTHKNTSSYDDCHYKADKTDCENNDGRVSLIYTGYSATMSQWNGWNREHVWPQSLGGGNTSGGGADLHHIRPSDAVVNSTRGNKLYGNVSSGTSVYGKNPATGYLGGEYAGNYFEPKDEVKGDVARICLYVWIRWGSSWGADSITEVFQSVDVLLAWCELDPVDTWEMGRNEVVQNIQGNRNVFIDYPEYAWLVFGREVPDDMQTPSGAAANGTASGGGTPACTHTNTEVRGKVDATCQSAGYTGDVYCIACGVKVSAGTTVAQATKHAWGEWEFNIDAGTKTRYCTYGCGASQTGTLTAADTCTHTSTVVKNATSPTCTSNGYSGDTYCSSCNKKLSTGTAIPANGHSWSDWVENTAAGVKTRTCQTCQSTESVSISAPACTHTTTEIRGQVSATCGTQGYTGDTYCNSCGEKTASGQVVPATGNHTWGDIVVTVEPTAEKDGEGVCTCTGCGATETSVITYTPPTTPSIPSTPSTSTDAWGKSYGKDEEKIVAILSWNAVYYFVSSLLTVQ